jgi:protein-disulfide isomerase
MKSLPVAIAALALLAGCTGKSEQANNMIGNSTTAATTANGSDWTQTATKTPEGGMLLGNPNAAVKLVEFGALSCSHCAQFSKESAEPLKALIAKGTVSYEFRTFMLNALDVPSSLLAKCNGPAPFFPIAEQLFAAQQEWMGNTQNITQADQQAMQTMQPAQAAQLLADKLGLMDFVAQRGVSADKAKACLADPAGIADLEKIQRDAQKEYQVTGTPTFIINGGKANVGTWKDLEPLLKQAGA